MLDHVLGQFVFWVEESVHSAHGGAELFVKPLPKVFQVFGIGDGKAGLLKGIINEHAVAGIVILPWIAAAAQAAVPGITGTAAAPIGAYCTHAE